MRACIEAHGLRGADGEASRHDRGRKSGHEGVCVRLCHRTFGVRDMRVSDGYIWAYSLRMRCWHLCAGIAIW